MTTTNHTYFSIPLKHLALLTLVLQNSILVIVLRYSRLIPGPQYFTTTAVLLSELAKLFFSFFLALKERKENLKSFEPLDQPRKSLFVDIWMEVFATDCWKMFIPAALYTVQNNLQYVAVSILDAATFQVTYQLKILTTALFSVVLLNRSLSARKWASLVLLTAGVALVQLPQSPAHTTTTTSDSPTTDDKAPTSTTEEGLPYAGQTEIQLMGLLAVGTACLLSGLAGVYFEKVLKGTQSSIWIRNTQLSLFSIPPALLAIYTQHGQGVINDGFFYGYNIVTFAAIACQAGGGIIVAMVVKYADNILKGFATSISIILSCVASIFLFGFVVTKFFLSGGVLVIFATYLYGLPDAPETKINDSSDVPLSDVETQKVVPLDGQDSAK